MDGNLSSNLVVCAHEPDQHKLTGQHAHTGYQCPYCEIEQLTAQIADLNADANESNDECGRLQADIERLTAQLPDEMKHCTIRFLECSKGHGRLWATNWVPSECPYCEIERLSRENEHLQNGKCSELRHEVERLSRELVEATRIIHGLLPTQAPDGNDIAWAQKVLAARPADEPKPAQDKSHLFCGTCHRSAAVTSSDVNFKLIGLVCERNNCPGRPEDKTKAAL